MTSLSEASSHPSSKPGAPGHGANRHGVGSHATGGHCTGGHGGCGPRAPLIDPTAQVHPSARVGPGAVVEAGTIVGPHCVLGAGARIGPGCRLGPRVQITPGAVVEAGCTLDTGAVIGGLDIADDLAPLGKAAAGGEEGASDKGVPAEGLAPAVRLGEGCHVGEYTVVQGSCRLSTCIEAGAFIMARCLIGPGVRIGRQVVVTNNSVVGPRARVGDFSVLGGFSVVGAGVELGQRVMVGGLSWVAEDVPPFLLVHGLPARPFDINRVGLRRSGFPPPVREALHRALRLLLWGPADLAEVFSQLEPDAAALDEVRELVAFVQSRPRLMAGWRRQEVHGRGMGDGGDDGA